MVNVVYSAFSVTTASLSYLVGLAFSAITPAKTGEVLKVFYIDKTGSEYGKALSIVIADRIIDIFMLFGSAIIGTIALKIIFSIEIIPIWTILLFILGLFLLTAILFIEKISSAIIEPIINIFIPKKMREMVNKLYENYNSGVSILIQNKHRIIPAIATGILSWVLPIIYGYTLALAIGINIPVLFFVALVPIICIVELAPISISGIGTRDVTLIYLFSIFSIEPESALIYSLFHLFLYWLTCLVGMLLWIKYPIDAPIDKGTQQ